MTSYFKSVSSAEIGVGTLCGAAALGVMIWQAVDLSNNAIAFAENASGLVVVLTSVCMILTYCEATIGTLGGKMPLFSMFVISTGLIATFAQTALLSVLVSSGQAYTLAAVVLIVQLIANSVMLAIIFSKIGTQNYRNLSF
jgi:hypothetical protein